MQKRKNNIHLEDSVETQERIVLDFAVHAYKP